jgi:hypothetical protein
MPGSLALASVLDRQVERKTTAAAATKCRNPRAPFHPRGFIRPPQIVQATRAFSLDAPQTIMWEACHTVKRRVFAQIMPARSIEGARAREATLGFKEFLSRVEEERMKKMITSPEMFEHFLPYAMAFGVGGRRVEWRWERWRGWKRVLT